MGYKSVTDPGLMGWQIYMDRGYVKRGGRTVVMLSRVDLMSLSEE